MAMNTALSTPRLACGRDAAAVWEDAETGRLDAHELRCPHCQAVATDAAVLHASTAELAAEPIEPPPALVDRVMSMVRTELRHDYLPLPTRPGPARIEHRSAAAVLRHAVDQMPGVRARSCRITMPDRVEVDGAARHDDFGGDPGTVVGISVAMAFGADLPTTAARVQQLILAASDRLLGLPVDQVNVTVVDVFDPTPGRESNTE